MDMTVRSLYMHTYVYDEYMYMHVPFYWLSTDVCIYARLQKRRAKTKHSPRPFLISFLPKHACLYTKSDLGML